MEKKVFMCKHCGNVVELMYDGKGQLICCGEPMILRASQTADPAGQKHVPLIEKVDGGYKVTVGSTLHPMEAEHYIMFIELDVDGVTSRKDLQPGDQPVAVFNVAHGKDVAAREYCNVHGMWRDK
ncbi:MAG: desulfoferrodoxin [Spirochaetales bacterium]|nr:desulfoferrodoxin [Spirochaetales bacterium]